MIDVAFHDEEKVRRLWREYFEMLHKKETIAPWDKKKAELITEMTKVVGFGKELTLQDVERVYAPIGQAEDMKRTREIGDELLRVLKESRGFAIVPKSGGSLSDTTR